MTNWTDQFATYEEACNYYGADTPAQCEDEGDWREAEATCEAAFGPYVYDLRGKGADPVEATYHAVREARLARKAAPRPFVDPAASVDDDMPF